MKSRKQKPQFAARKKAFDTVMEAYRQAHDVNGGMGAVSISDGGKGVSNPVRPSLTDFRCDVEKILERVKLPPDMVVRFHACYVHFDSENPIDIERYADKVIGGGRHGLEQGVGSLFIKHGIYPLHGKGGYFHCVRQPRGTV